MSGSLRDGVDWVGVECIVVIVEWNWSCVRIECDGSSFGVNWYCIHDGYCWFEMEKGRVKNHKWSREWRSEVFPYLCGFRSIHSCNRNRNGRDALNTANCLGIRGILREYAISC